MRGETMFIFNLFQSIPFNWIEPVQLKIIADIATALVPIILLITALLVRQQLQNQELELAVANYNTIFQHLDHPSAKASRRVIYNSHEHICKLEQSYREKINDEVLDSVNEIAKHMV